MKPVDHIGNTLLNPNTKRQNDLITAVFRNWGIKSIVSWPHSQTGNWAILARFGPMGDVTKTGWLPANSINRDSINRLAADLYFEYKADAA